ncbi:MAG: hypothetical protein DHS80DRAFT_25816 [Piptocephalis tieghemiana]|nr:MAG: hypothetical protein DHS80DRAFT_25816 [Piptocephalis tieghemiana]
MHFSLLVSLLLLFLTSLLSIFPSSGVLAQGGVPIIPPPVQAAATPSPASAKKTILPVLATPTTEPTRALDAPPVPDVVKDPDPNDTVGDVGTGPVILPSGRTSTVPALPPTGSAWKGSSSASPPLSPSSPFPIYLALSLLLSIPLFASVPILSVALV